MILWSRKRQSTPVFLAWKIPRAEESGGLQCMGSKRVGHYEAHTHPYFHFISCLFPCLSITAWSMFPKDHPPHLQVEMHVWFSGYSAETSFTPGSLVKIVFISLDFHHKLSKILFHFIFAILYCSLSGMFLLASLNILLFKGFPREGISGFQCYYITLLYE